MCRNVLCVESVGAISKTSCCRVILAREFLTFAGGNLLRVEDVFVDSFGVCGEGDGPVADRDSGRRDLSCGRRSHNEMRNSGHFRISDPGMEHAFCPIEQRAEGQPKALDRPARWLVVQGAGKKPARKQKATIFVLMTG